MAAADQTIPSVDNVFRMSLAGTVSAETASAAPSTPVQPTAKNDATELAKQSQNPVANLISLQFQWNTYFQTGPQEKTQNVLLVQPVIPMSMNEDWNFIARPIIPLIDQPAMTDSMNRNCGLGNIQFEGFFSPKKPVGGWILGVGPYFEFPTNSNPDGQFGTDNWSAGAAFLALKMEGPWVVGGLLTHLSSYYGNDPETNLTGFQPIVNYNFDDGWYLNYSPVWTIDWTEDSNNQWTVPIGGGVGRVFHVGKQAINAKVGSYYMVESPADGPDWQLQCVLTFLFPK
jgi:hypothetical protein